MTGFTKAIKSWKWPSLAKELVRVVKPLEVEKLTLYQLGNLIKRELAKRNKEERVNLELATLSWLYDLVRADIKRGRNFLVERALAEKKADCLAYGQILKTIAKRFGLDVGIVEVIVDNAGRYTSHPCNLLKLSDGSWRLVDLWYGSKNINHKRIGAHIKEKGQWKIKDLNQEEFAGIEDIKGLSEMEIKGLTFYTLGNIAWNKRDWDEAIGFYTKAISFYPENARIYYNLGLAYQKKHELRRAGRNLAEARKKDPSYLRLLAEEHEEIEELIKLDELGMDEEEQREYLFHQGFITGKKE